MLFFNAIVNGFQKETGDVKNGFVENKIQCVTVPEQGHAGREFIICVVEFEDHGKRTKHRKPVSDIAHIDRNTAQIFAGTAESSRITPEAGGSFAVKIRSYAYCPGAALQTVYRRVSSGCKFNGSLMAQQVKNGEYFGKICLP